MIWFEGVQPIDVTNTIITLLIPTIIARIIVGMTYPKRTHILWTFLLPTAALLFFVARVAISRQEITIFGADTWEATISWGGLLVTHIIATIYSWWPLGLRMRNRTV